MKKCMLRTIGIAIYIAVIVGAVILTGGCDRLNQLAEGLPLPPEVTLPTTPATTTTQPPVTGLQFKLHSPLHNYVSWTGVDRSGWPTKEVKGTMNGLLYVNGRKCEWIPRGRENTGLKNALNPGEYYQPDIEAGSVLRLEIRDVHGKLVNPTYVGEIVYR